MKEEFNEMVSVVITTYGRGAFLNNAIESVLNQTYKNIEIIVIDDNGNRMEDRKKTEEIMNKYVSYSQIKYIKNLKNKGACSSRNIGINLSKGKYIAFLDDDDEFYKSKIEKQVLKIRNLKKINKKVAIIFSRMEIVNESFKVGTSKYNLKKDINSLNDFQNGVYITGTSSLLIEREALAKVNGFSEIESCQEALLILKLLEEGYLFTGIKEELVIYRKHSNGSIGKSEKAIKGQEKYLNFLKESIENNSTMFDKKEAWLNYNHNLFIYKLQFGKKEALKTLLRLIKIDFKSSTTLKCFYKLLSNKKI